MQYAKIARETWKRAQAVRREGVRGVAPKPVKVVLAIGLGVISIPAVMLMAGRSQASQACGPSIGAQFVTGAGGGGQQVTVSYYGGPNDPATGSTGYRGDNLNQHPDSFAELNMGTALGNLPYMTPITVSYNGRSITVYKRDIGGGGSGLSGKPRAVDLWYAAAAQLGIGPSNGLVLASVNVGNAADGNSTATQDVGLCSQLTAPSGTAGKILAMAQSILGAPYLGAHHATAFSMTAAWVKANGTDCSGFVSWLMGPRGLNIWKSPLATPSIPSAPGLLSGPGAQITLMNNPNPGNAGHVIIEILGRWFQEGGAADNVNMIPPGELAYYQSSGLYQPWHPKGL